MKKLSLHTNNLFFFGLFFGALIFLNCTCKHCCHKSKETTTESNLASSNQIHATGVQNEKHLDSIKAIRLQQKLKALEADKKK